MLRVAQSFYYRKPHWAGRLQKTASEAVVALMARYLV